MDMKVPDNIKIVQVPCTGRIETLHMLKAFEEGVDGVYVAGCQDDSCQFVSGIDKAAKRVEKVKTILEDLEIEPERISLYNLSAGQGHRFVEIAYESIEKLKKLGPTVAK
jgi:coenzyme F420-reducing hydrogenase delta subunit